ncbi:MAG: hypothetical protein PHT41_08230 [Candidatus Omnitrophica bacterium]|nr:hypothetical protein [Candidatus Omnitrophota bacterium]MDD5238307.1 hypothetical protein [Candidatus Omnitrophota bacterium]
MMRLKRNKGQSTLEYLLILTGIIAAIIVATQSVVKPTVGNIFNKVTNEAQNAVSHLNYQ